MSKPFIVSCDVKLLGVDVEKGVNKEGKEFEYYSCSVFCTDNGWCGSLSVADKATFERLNAVVGSDVSLKLAYNFDYKSLRVKDCE